MLLRGNASGDAPASRFICVETHPTTCQRHLRCWTLERPGISVPTLRRGNDGSVFSAGPPVLSWHKSPARSRITVRKTPHHLFMGDSPFAVKAPQPVQRLHFYLLFIQLIHRLSQKGPLSRRGRDREGERAACCNPGVRNAMPRLRVPALAAFCLTSSPVPTYTA